MTNSTPPALVDITPETTAPLSMHYANSDYRLSPTQPKANWARLSKPPVKAHCDECARIQHETRGASGPRMQPRHRRTIPDGGPKLLLCGRHAEAWRERDRIDAPAEAASGKGRR